MADLKAEHVKEIATKLQFSEGRGHFDEPSPVW